MISFTQAIILGLLQGVSELFPVSSLGHSVILPRLLGWHINQNASFFLDFLVATHLATAIVLFLFFWRDWVRIIGGILKSLKEREIKGVDAKLGWLLVVGTIPAGILGLLLEDFLRTLFASAQVAAFFLAMNGVMLYGAEALRRKKKEQSDLSSSDERISKLNYFQAAKIGVAQAIALIPGFSRTGASLSGGLLIGLSHEDALRYAFLLSTPIIGAAAALKIPDLLSQSPQLIKAAFLGALAAALSAFFSVKFLVKYFKTQTLTPFAIYCFITGTAISLIFLLGR